MPDYTDVMAAFEAHAAAAAATSLTHRQGARVVVLKLEELLASDEWNIYRDHLMGLQQMDEAEREQLRAQIESADTTAEQDRHARRRLQRVLGRLDARTQALALPKQIIAQHQATPLNGPEPGPPKPLTTLGGSGA